MFCDCSPHLKENWYSLIRHNNMYFFNLIHSSCMSICYFIHVTHIYIRDSFEDIAPI